MNIQPLINSQAIRQGGYITRRQVEELGLKPSAIDRRIRRGDFDPVASGVYRIFDSDDHIDLIRGAILTLPDAIASHQSAAHLLTFPTLPQLVPTVTVHSRTTHLFPPVTVRRCADLEVSQATSVRGIRTTNVLRTVFDLAGILEFDEIDRIVESLVIAKRLRISQLEKLILLLARRGKRGTSNARRLVLVRGSGNEVDPTVLERQGRQVLSERGIAEPVAQYPLPWDPTRRFDDAYPEHRAAIEWDSRSWHSRLEEMRRDRGRDREAAAHGWIVIRITWDDLVETPDEVAASLRAALQSRAP